MWPTKELIVLYLELRIMFAEEGPASDVVEVDFNLNSSQPIVFRKTEVPYRDSASQHQDMLEFVLSIVLTLAVLAAIFIVCCYCMSRSDKQLQKYVLALAKHRGRKLDKRQLKCAPPSQQPIADSCPVLLAEAGIIIP